MPIELNFPSPSHHRQRRRRRVVCYETTDSSDDDSDRYSSGDDHYRRHHRRRHHRRRSLPPSNDQYNHHGDESQPQQSAAQIHNLLGNVWRKTERAAHNLHQPNNSANINSQWQAMQNNRPSAPPAAQATSNAWQAMRNSPPTAQATNNAWQAMRNSPPNAQATGNAWQAMRNSSPTGQAANNAWQAMQSAPGSMHSAEEQAVRNVWNRAANAENRKADILSNAFNRMGQAPGQIIQPPPPQPTNQAAANSFLAARNIPFGANQQNSAVANAWGRADNAVHNMPSHMSNPPWNHTSQASQGSAVNSVWNHLQQNPTPFSNPPYPQPSMGGPPRNAPLFRPPMSGPQSGPNFAPAPTSFGSLLSRAHQQHSSYAGAAYPAGPSYWTEPTWINILISIRIRSASKARKNDAVASPFSNENDVFTEMLLPS